MVLIGVVTGESLRRQFRHVVLAQRRRMTEVLFVRVVVGVAVGARRRGGQQVMVVMIVMMVMATRRRILAGSGGRLLQIVLLLVVVLAIHSGCCVTHERSLPERRRWRRSGCPTRRYRSRCRRRRPTRKVVVAAPELRSSHLCGTDSGWVRTGDG